ncbi:MAG: putative chromosome-partitioning protein ParB [Syntrophaceae bacterium PtaU1.Bin231]|nr:MAG: putative chromosome-partitioning protein ParB [Syntrophaceae bacterium PtaU1.Bin231]
MIKKNSLGRGLGAMFPDLLEKIGDKPVLVTCGIEELVPNRYQARKDFDPEEHKSLVASIRKSGIIQPIVARKFDGGYEIIAGERRWRAAQEAGLKSVPVILREAADQDAAVFSLIENLLRANLNPMEEAEAFLRLIHEFGLSHEALSATVGKDRSTITNTLRLLKLPKEIREAIAKGTLSAGHARAILALETIEEQNHLFRAILSKGLNVREAEAFARGKKKAGHVKKARGSDEHLAEIEKRLARRLLTRVTVRSGRKGGAIEIRFGSPEELERLLEILLRT